MKVHPVPVRHDNYAYILQSSIDGSAVFVDPFDIGTVQKAAEGLGIKSDQVVGLLTTHHHFDHSGGNEDFAKTFPGRPIFGGSTQIPSLTNKVSDGDKVDDLLKGIEIKCLATPCHTQDHICYFVVDKADSGGKGVFTGDSLFISGCGRFFEGTPTEMLAAMDKLAGLPDETIVYCGHEYTKANVAFSAAILPENEEPIKKLVQDLKDGRNGGRTTGVYSIKDERSHNPFMRTRDEVVQRAVQKHSGGDEKDPVEVMRFLRELKNGGQVKASI